LVLNKGADVHVMNDISLKIACKHGRLEIVKLLIKYGGDIHLENDYLLKVAKRFAEEHVVKYLESVILKEAREKELAKV